MSASPRGLSSTLVFAAVVTALVSALGAPLIPTVARDAHTSISAAQWTLTLPLMVGAISAPIFGRLGDGRRRRGALITGLAMVVAGCILDAIVSRNLVVLVAGRALQGVGIGLLPLAMAIARAHLPAERIASTIALLSISAAAGVGLGYPLTGLLAERFGLAACFWFGAAISALAVICVSLVVPSSRQLPAARPDLLGAALLAVALASLLTLVAQVHSWGWHSAAVLTLLGVAMASAVAWVSSQLRSATPLVERRLLADPAVFACDVCALVMGIAMYANLPTITEFVQAPRSSGYGLGQAVFFAGLCQIPLSVATFGASRLLPRLIGLFGRWALLPIGCLLVAGSDVLFFVLHSSLWEAMAAMAFIGAGIGLTSAITPTLIVRAVPESETGSALGFFQVVRYVGFSFGSALAAALLASDTVPGSRLPREGGYMTVLIVAGATCVLAGFLVFGLARRVERRPTSSGRVVVAG